MPTSAWKPFKLVLPRSVATAIANHVNACLPNEGCGLLAVKNAEPCSLAVQFFPGANLDRSPFRFTMDPADVLHALESIDRAGWMLGAIVHSHPNEPGLPSTTDIAEARYLRSLLLIVGRESGGYTPRAWRFGASRADVQEIPVSITSDKNPESTAHQAPDIHEPFQRIQKEPCQDEHGNGRRSNNHARGAPT